VPDPAEAAPRSQTETLTLKEPEVRLILLIDDRLNGQEPPFRHATQDTKTKRE